LNRIPSRQCDDIDAGLGGRASEKRKQDQDGKRESRLIWLHSSHSG